MIMRPTERDFSKIAQIHLKAFNGFFLSGFGEAVLRRYYRAIASFDGSVFFIEHDGDAVVGFVCGCGNPAQFNRQFVRNNTIELAWAAAKACLHDTSFLPRLLTRGRDIGHFPQDSGTISLLSIAVAPEFSGQGLGKRLLHEFIAESAVRGYKKVYLTTDREGNDSVNGFYLGNGFHLIGYYDSGNGRIMNEYLSATSF